MDFSRFTFYDILGYFVPGFTFLFSFFIVDEDMFITVTKVYFDGNEGLLVFCGFVASYVVGHMIQTCSNFTIDLLPFSKKPPKNFFQKYLKENFSDKVKHELLEITGYEKECDGFYEELKKRFWDFYYSGLEKNKEISIFVGLTGFYRGMALSFFVSGVYLIASSGGRLTDQIGLSFIVFFVLFLFRLCKFKNYLANAVYLQAAISSREES